MNLLYVVAVPYVLSLILAIPPVRKLIPKIVLTWSIPAVMAVLFGMLLQYFPQVQAEGAVVPDPIAWIPEIGLTISFYLDGLSLLFGLVVTGIGTIIFFYTGYYFEDKAKQARFTMWLLAFTGAMLGLVLGGNLLFMFISWELTSITSFMLIGFYGDKDEEARISARRALVITGAGGLALLGGVLLLGGMVGQIANAPTGDDTEIVLSDVAVTGTIGITTSEGDGTATVFGAEDENIVPFSFEYTDMLALDTVTDHPWFTAMLVLMMIGAFTKSAQ
ncbi:MAG: proton-conducting transporter membrane subunit, partial [Chloroflexota bacterium]